VPGQCGNGRVVGGINGVETEAKGPFEEGDVSGEIGRRQADFRRGITLDWHGGKTNRLLKKPAT
jgi:hypothetical protein